MQEDDPLLRAAQLDYRVRHVGPQWVAIGDEMYECHWPVPQRPDLYIATRPKDYRFYLVDPSIASVEAVEEDSGVRAELIPCGTCFTAARVIQMVVEGFLGDTKLGLHYYGKYVTRVCLVGGFVDPADFVGLVTARLSLWAEAEARAITADILAYREADSPTSARLRRACAEGVVWLAMKVYMELPQ